MRIGKDPTELGFTRYDRPRLEKALRGVTEARDFRRLQAVLLVALGRDIAEVAQIACASKRSVYGWLERYLRRHRAEDLTERPRSGRPMTAEVAARPLVMIPPCINKYYILDLQPENSFVGHAVASGNTVFMVSWRNVGAEQGHFTWDDYLEQGVFTPLRVAREIAGSDQVNALGFCVGGTLLGAALAVLAYRKEDPVASVTLLAAMLEFSETGQIGVFVDEASIAAREAAIGGGEEIVDRLAVLGIRRGANRQVPRGGDADLVAVCADVRMNSLGGDGSASEGLLREQQAELVAAQASNDIVGTSRILEHAGHALEQLITRQVAGSSSM